MHACFERRLLSFGADKTGACSIAVTVDCKVKPLGNKQYPTRKIHGASETWLTYILDAFVTRHPDILFIGCFWGIEVKETPVYT